MEPPPQRRICVTGASGFLASHIVLALLRAGYVVHATLRASKYSTRVRNTLRTLHPSGPTHLQFFDADLLEPGSFDAAVAGCEVVIHTASPVRAKSSEPVSELIDPAVRGTENVLRACQRSPSVRTVVLTSSYTTMVGEKRERDNKVYTEADWNHDSNLETDPYALSKVLAEELAWRFVKTEPVNFRLVALHPTMVIGPLLLNRLPVSVTPIWDILRGQLCNPQLFFPFVDVRDVAQAHILAFENPNTPPRTLLCSSSWWWHDWARVLAKRYPEYPVATWSMPNLFGYIIGLLHPRVSFNWLWKRLGRSYILDATRSQHELNLSYTPPEQTLYDCAESLITRGMVPTPTGARSISLRSLRAFFLAVLLWSLLRRRVHHWLIR